jgi:hypothetical protein
MAGFENDVVYAKNADYTQADNQAALESNGLVTDGELWIGSTALNAGGTHINVGNITSSSLTIGYSSPDITIETNGGGSPIEQITVENSTVPGTNPVLPTASGNITITGGQQVNASLANVIQTHSLAANSFAIMIQRANESATPNTTQNGVCHFDSTSFVVDSSGFVQSIGGGFTWNDASGAFSPLKNNGYFITGTATGTLPASPSQGDTIQFFVDHATQDLTIQASGAQIIRMGSLVSSAGGTALSTQQGDSVELVYRASDTCWCAIDFIGTWVLA